MSNNKYIIDKDSLTGIADAVRDKLGPGEAITDDDAGYYEGEGLIAKFNLGNKSISSGANLTFFTLGSDSDSTEYDLYFQKPFSSVTLSFTHSGTYDRLQTLKVNEVSGGYVFSNDTSKVFNFLHPQSYLKITCIMEGGYSASATFNDLTVTLFDESNNSIGVKTVSIKQYNFLTGPALKRIPFTINDIQNKITNYLAKSNKVFLSFLQKSDTEKYQIGGVQITRYIKIGGIYDLDFASSSPTYITDKVPNLKPENIIFMYFLGSANYNNREFIFDPSIKPMEHYTSSSITEGKRLSSATDYYFFPDGAGYNKDNKNHGIMGMWDKNNKILDFGFQTVSSRSGNSFSSNYCTDYGYPQALLIVYKEV